MTIPSERTLAVLRTRRFLLDLADPTLTPRIPLRLRQRALSLLKHLPTGADLTRAAQGLPDTFGPVNRSDFGTASLLTDECPQPLEGMDGFTGEDKQ